jgi:hypothetical protein
MWHTLGRPRQSAYLDAVFPEGVKMCTIGDPRGQPVMMHLLSSRILAGTAPQWTAELRQAWANEVESLRKPFAAAVEPSGRSRRLPPSPGAATERRCAAGTTGYASSSGSS